jgi:orotidine-5'-phosphate decarboxylase
MNNAFAHPHQRILVALDFSDMEQALHLVRTVAPHVGGFKVGLELVNAVGFDIFSRLQDAGAERVFYDAKFHDIPNTVAGAVRAVAKRGVWMVNVHAGGGLAMCQAAREAANTVSHPPLLVGVTVLTSISEPVLNNELRVPGPVVYHVEQLARLSQRAGLDGVVASPHEVQTITKACGPQFVTVIPGVRPRGVDVGDQARVATPGEAIANGAHYLVIGRAITAADNPIRAAQNMVAEITQAL